MPEQLKCRCVGSDEWQCLAPTFSDFNFEQSWGYSLATAARMGARAVFLSIEGNNGPVGAASVRIKAVPGLRRGIAYIPSGPLMAMPGDIPAAPERIAAVVAALTERLVHREGHVLRFRLPVLPPLDVGAIDQLLRRAGCVPTNRAKTYSTFAVDLRPEPEVLRHSLDTKWRGDLRFAERAGLELDTGEGDSYNRRFEELYDIVRSEKGFENDLPPRFFFDFHDTAVRSEVLLARDHGKDIGGIVVTTVGRIALYHFGATVAGGRKARAGYFLNWHAMMRARERGQRWYDLGGVDANTNPGVYRFKKRTGGQYFDCIGPYQVKSDGALTALTLQLEGLRRLVRRDL